jgi:hypothetical protein
MAGPTYKQLSWTVKFTSDVVKVPDVTSATPIAGSYDLPQAADPTEDDDYGLYDVLSYAPDGSPIEIIVVKVDAASLKDLQSPLRIRLFLPEVKGDKPAPAKHTDWRPVTADSGKNGVVYASMLTDFATKAKSWKLQVDNENLVSINLVVTVAYGPGAT